MQDTRKRISMIEHDIEKGNRNLNAFFSKGLQQNMKTCQDLIRAQKDDSELQISALSTLIQSVKDNSSGPREDKTDEKLLDLRTQLENAITTSKAEIDSTIKQNEDKTQ